MTATVVFAQVQPSALDSSEFAQVTVHVDARIISAMRARQVANGWLLWNIGERVAVGAPELIVDQRLVWRFPLRWTSSKEGVLADLIAELRLDALSGEVLETDQKIAEIQQRVHSVARALQAAVS
ncbi:MAG: hypothetical protein U0350_43715 [Caldilineaceae bacterium]